MGLGCSKRDAFTPKPYKNIASPLPSRDDDVASSSAQSERGAGDAKTVSAHAYPSGNGTDDETGPQDGTDSKTVADHPRNTPVTPWLELLKEVADADLWNGVQRSERPGWKDYFDKVDAILQEPRKGILQDVVDAALRGDAEAVKGVQGNPHVRMFISSTFTDTKAERNQLMKDVYPFVRSVCRRLGVDFGTVDMRWGVTDTAKSDHSTVNMCLREIQRCQSESAGPSFLGILSHKNGYQPLPASIEQSEFSTLLDYLDENNTDTALIREYYILDTNASVPEYVLKAMSKDMDSDTWWKVETLLKAQLRQAATACFTEADDRLKKYSMAVTGLEFEHGVFEDMKSRDRCLIVIRRLDDVEDDLHKNRRVIDMDGDSVDEKAQTQLKALISKVEKSIPDTNIIHSRYSEANTEECKRCIRDICDQVCKYVLDAILQQYTSNFHAVADPLVREISEHCHQSADKRSLFVGKEQELIAIKDYLKSRVDSPLVIHGESGCGKSALLAEAAGRARAAFPKSVCVQRFIGTTSRSGTARALLGSICEQITRAYQGNVDDVPSSYKELSVYFRKCLDFSTKKRPLIVFLDALDQMSDEDNGRRLGWLPLDASLPENTKVIVSCLGDLSLDVLHQHIKDNDNFVAMNKLLPCEGPEILSQMLKANGRELTTSQKDVLLSNFVKRPYPLYLRLSADVALKWKSFDVIHNEDISDNMKGMINILFKRIESTYPETLVRHALAYITAGKSGISQTELEDILSCDDEVLDAVFQWWVPPFRRIPPLLWTRIRNDLGTYLAERGTDGINTYTWYHRQFLEVARERYLDAQMKDSNTKFETLAREAIANYFEGKWERGKVHRSSKSTALTVHDRKVLSQQLILGGNRVNGRQINKRKLNELPYQCIEIKDWGRLMSFAFELSYIEAKFEVGLGNECFRELDILARESGNEEARMVVRFVGSYLAILLREPHSIYQLAQQQHTDHPMRRRVAKMQQKDLPVQFLNSKVELEADDSCIVTLQGHKMGIKFCQYSANGEMILSSTENGSISIWDAVTGAEITSLPVQNDQDDDAKYPCCFSRAGNVIAVCTNTSEVILMDAYGTKIRNTKSKIEDPVAIQFSPDDQVLAVAFECGTVVFLSSGDLSVQMETTFNISLMSIDYSPDGSFLAVALQSGLGVLEMSSPNSTYTLRDVSYRAMQSSNSRRQFRDMMLCCQCSPDGKQIMTGSTDNAVGVWEKNPDSNQFQLKEKNGGHNGFIWCIKFTRAGDVMITCASDRTSMLWRHCEAYTWERISVVHGHALRVISVSIEPVKEECFVTASLDGTLKIWDMAAVRSKTAGLARVDTHDADARLHFNVLAVSSGHVAKSVGWSTKCCIEPLPGNEDNSGSTWTPDHRGYLKRIEFTPDETRLVSLDHGHRGALGKQHGAQYTQYRTAHKDARVSICNIKDGDANVMLEQTDVPGPVAFCCGKSCIVIGSIENDIYMFNADTYQKLHCWKWDKDKKLSTLACSRDDDMLLLATGENTGKLWRVRSAKETFITNLPNHDANITVSAFSPEGNVFVTGVQSGKIYVWNTSENAVTMRCSLNAHVSDVKDVNFSKDGLHLVSCGDQSVRVWGVGKEDVNMKCAFYAPVNCCVFKMDNAVLAGDATGNLHELVF